MEAFAHAFNKLWISEDVKSSMETGKEVSRKS